MLSSFLPSNRDPECLHPGDQIVSYLRIRDFFHLFTDCPLVSTEDHHQGFTAVLFQEPENILADDDKSDAPEGMCDPILPSCCLLYPDIKHSHAHHQLVVYRVRLAQCVVLDVPEEVAEGVGTGVVAAGLHEGEEGGAVGQV